jgi:transglutaminase-like putative cysteine protease
MMMTFMKKKLFKKNLIYSGLLSCFLTTALFAQNFDQQFLQLKEAYPDAKVINLIDFKTIEIKIDKDELYIKQSYEQENLYMDDLAKGASEDYLSYNSFLKLENIKATSYPFVDGKYKKVKVKDFTSKDVLTGSFHDDVRQVDFVYPLLGTAAKTNLSYDEILKNPRFLSPIYFGNFNPILHKKVEFIVDNNVEISFKKFNTDNFEIDFKTDKKRSETIYTWEIKSVAAFKYENSSANAKEILPHVIPIINSYTIDGKKTPILGEVSQLYNWYYSMVKDVNQNPILPELKQKAVELTKDKTSDLEKVKAIYYWVQQEIKYIAFEFELGGFIPREANDVYNKRFGDCKDNSSILSVMLDAVGLEGHLTWVGTRKIPYTYSELATPHVDNHMILTYIDQDGKSYYLDATGRYHSLDLPTSFIQGKEVLIGLDKDNFKIQKVPFIDSNTNFIKETSNVSITGTTLEGSSSLQLNAYPKIDLFSRREDIKKEDLKSFYRNRFKKESNKFIITTFEEENLYDYDKAFQLNYEFEMQDYCNQIGDELYVNLNLNSPISDYKTNQEFIYSIEIDHKKLYSFENRLHIPENYEVNYLPKNLMLSNPYFDAEISYQVEGDEIVYKHKLDIHFIKLNAEEQKEVNTAIEEVQKQIRELLILKEKKNEIKN